MTSSAPRVSVIVPVYNARQMLPDALESAFNQTFCDWEIIVVDDGSTDGTGELLRTYEDRIRVIDQPNGGASSARNAGIRAARGEFIAFLDSDDLWEADKLQRQVEELQAHSEAGVCFCECLYFDAAKTWPADFGRQVPETNIFEALLSHHFISMSSVMVRRACLDATGGFDTGLVGCEDYNLFLRLAKQFEFRFLPQPLVKLRCHEGNLSNDLPRMCRDEIANLDKIAAMFPDMAIPKRRLQAQIWFRFGQYHFDAGDFALARDCFARSIRLRPRRAAAYVFLATALLPGGVRQALRNTLRALRGGVNRRGAETQREKRGEANSLISSLRLCASAVDSSLPCPVMMVTWSLVAGGSETYALTLARHLDRAQFSPMLCALDQGGVLEDDLRRLNIPHRVMHRRPGLQFGLMWRMFRLFRRHRVRVVHTHHFNQLFYSLIGAKLCGARLIHTEHSVESYKRPRLRLALRLLSLACHRVVAIGEDGWRVLRHDVGIPQRKLQIIRAGVDLDAFNVSRDEARHDLELDAEAPVTAIVARLSPEKNHRLLLESWARVVEHVPNALLLIAGDGSEAGALREQIKDLNLSERVRMLGVRRDVARVLASCDVFVLSSDREGLPVAVLEAMAASRAVVATAVGDLPLVVQEGETGLLVPPRDAPALTQALIALLRDRERAARCGEAGKRAVAGFGLKAMVEAHERLYGSS